ncbi:hypothetical protein [Cellulomonas sp.]|uniref:hypothetical protein n=1 Tax=Cellulomonas sp. TaxID=40001 RepID=UPI001B0C69B8|nr:hypothetical protein [Cellulomonas sp.]MBO9553826.1 hypothetical protein [Cellulomonas sp.]
MSSDSTEQSPFSRPGFVAAAVVVALILVVGGVLVGRVFLGDDDTAAAVAPSGTAVAPSAAPEDDEAGDDDADSVCGLRGKEIDGSLSMPPEAVWAYQGTTGYPTSDEFGPAKTSDAGVRYCFARTPEGALFSAANALAQTSDQSSLRPWAEYFLVGPGRDAVLAEDTGSNVTGSNGTRMDIAGFRLLSYDGERATVDLAVRYSISGQLGYMSTVYPMVWADGDWKVSVPDADSSLNVAKIPDLAGYVAWAP